MKKTVRACVDRREGDLLVLVADKGDAYLYLNAEEYPFPVGTVVSLTVEGDTVLCAVALKEETEERKKKNESRLSALFQKGKKPTR